MDNKKNILINGEPTVYYITSDGKVYNEKTKTWLQGRISSNGYYDYFLRINGELKSFRAHRLVAEYFLEKPSDLTANIVNHKDGNKLNNNVNNLEWVTQSKNVSHAYEHDLINKNKNIQYYKEDNDQEDWREVHYNKLYKVSNFGRVLNTKTNRILIGKKDTGYIRYELRSVDGARKTFLGHRLVYKAFNPEFDIDNRKRIINHKNGDKFDNRLENLEEVSISENCQHAYKTGLNSKAKVVLQYDKNNNFIQKFNSANEAARETGIRQGLISSACCRKGTSHGFIWRYEEDIIDQKDVQRL